MLVDKLPRPIHLHENVREPVRHLKFLPVVRRATSKPLHHRGISCVLGRGETLQILHLEFGIGEVMEGLVVVFEERTSSCEAVDVIRHGFFKQIEWTTRLDGLVELFVHHVGPATDVVQDFLFFLVELLLVQLGSHLH